MPTLEKLTCARRVADAFEFQHHAFAEFAVLYALSAAIVADPNGTSGEFVPGDVILVDVSGAELAFCKSDKRAG